MCVVIGYSGTDTDWRMMKPHPSNVQPVGERWINDGARRLLEHAAAEATVAFDDNHSGQRVSCIGYSQASIVAVHTGIMCTKSFIQLELDLNTSSPWWFAVSIAWVACIAQYVAARRALELPHSAKSIQFRLASLNSNARKEMIIVFRK